MKISKLVQVLSRWNASTDEVKNLIQKVDYKRMAKKEILLADVCCLLSLILQVNLFIADIIYVIKSPNFNLYGYKIFHFDSDCLIYAAYFTCILTYLQHLHTAFAMFLSPFPAVLSISNLRHRIGNSLQKATHQKLFIHLLHS